MEQKVVLCGICPYLYTVDGVKPYTPTEKEKEIFLDNMKKGLPEDTVVVYSPVPLQPPFIKK